MSSVKHILLITAIMLTVICMSVESAPFFDAIYDAINGNPRRSYGYSGYGNYGYNGYNGYNGYYNGYNGYNNDYNGYRQPEKPQRQGKTFKDICRVHFPDSIAVPGAGGIVCPY